jgi:hypothetical protein
VAAVREANGAVRLYVDGTLVASGTITPSTLPSVSAQMYTARAPSIFNGGTADQVFYGDIAFLALTNSALSAAEVQAYIPPPSPPVTPPMPLLPPPSPLQPPPAAPGQASGVSGDPHLKGAHGEEADFKGEHRAVYNVLSAKNLSFNLLVEHDIFRTSYSKLNVHGSWVRASLHVIRTARSGRLLHVFFHAIDPRIAIVTEVCNGRACQRHELRKNAPSFKIENLIVSLHRRRLTVTTGQWTTTSVSTVGRPHPGRLRMNVEMKTTYRVDDDHVAPHG